MSIEEAMLARISRRDALKRALATTAAGGAIGLLEACGSNGTTPAGTQIGGQASAGTPKRGGTLRIGSQGASDTDTFEGQNPVTNPDFARVFQVFSPLAQLDTQGRTQMMLAQEITPNKSATEWTIRLKQGVTFHDGRPLTADDLLFSLKRIVGKRFSGAAMIAPLDLGAAKKLDQLTLRIPTKTPLSTLVDILVSSPYYMIVPQGFDPKRPIGTGPFKFESFTPGQQSVTTRFADYWEHGLPYLDRIVTTEYNDEQSQINALLGGSIDLTDLLSGQSIGTLKGGGATVVVSKSGTWNPFTMRTDQAPFDDVRVRQAFKWIVDRRRMNDVVFQGLGTVANDVYGLHDPLFDTTIPQREQDIAQAKSLLKAAGREGLSVELVTTDLSQGMVAEAQVFAQDAQKAGVNVKIRQLTTTNFFTGYLKYTFSQDYWYPGRYLGQVPQASLGTAPYNAPHWNDPAFRKLYDQAVATTDESRKRELAYEMQRREHDDGGFMIPVFAPIIDAHSSKVGGFQPSDAAQYPLANFGFKSMWLT